MRQTYLLAELGMFRPASTKLEPQIQSIVSYSKSWRVSSDKALIQAICGNNGLMLLKYRLGHKSKRPHEIT